MFWKASGRDSRSDTGSWVVLVHRKTKAAAINAVTKHLIDLDREDLYESWIKDVSLATDLGPVVYSNVEQG